MTQQLLVRKTSHPKRFAIWVALLALFVLGMGAWAVFKRSPAVQAGPVPVGTAIVPPQLMPNFELLDQNNRLTRLSDLRGKPVLLFFGYTHCPDVCPLNLVVFKRIKTALGERAAGVQFVFVSVDGERDTPAVMQHYIASFDPSFIGLTERAFVVAQVAAPYGARFERKITRTTQTEYVVGHTTDTYLLDGEGRLTKKYAYETESAAIAQDVMGILKQDPSASPP
jgi:protein SCO1